MNRSRFFNWGLLVLAFMLLLPGLALAQGGDGNNNRRQFNPQPVLIYTVSGGTIAGETLQTLIIYDNGLAIWSNLDGGTGGTADIQTTQLTTQQVNTLLRDLRRAGAMRANLQGNNVDEQPADVPLTTITVFFNPGGVGSPGRTLAQTFSFFTPEGTRARINDVISNFLNDNFGGGGTGTGG
jgi:hypothetical protein